MSVFDTINDYLHAPLDVLHKGEDVIQEAVDLPGQILGMIQQMQVPLLIIAGVVMIKELNG